MEEIEVWKDIEGYEGLYQVSNFGRVKSLPRNTTKGKILKPIKNKDGYMKVNLHKDGKKKMFSIHRLVCLAFLKNDYNLPCINHKDENKENNRVENLEFCSYQYNNTYNNIHKKSGKTRRKLILQFTKEGKFIREWDSMTTIFKELNISQGNICNCCKGRYETCGGFIWKYKE